MYDTNVPNSLSARTEEARFPKGRSKLREPLRERAVPSDLHELQSMRGLQPYATGFNKICWQLDYGVCYCIKTWLKGNTPSEGYFQDNYNVSFNDGSDVQPHIWMRKQHSQKAQLSRLKDSSFQLPPNVSQGMGTIGRYIGGRVSQLICKQDGEAVNIVLCRVTE